MVPERLTDETVLFEGKRIRRVTHKGDWWFSIIDVIETLTESERPRKYWNDLKNKLFREDGTQLSDNIGQLKMSSTDGKMRLTDCCNVETLFRIISTVRSPKADQMKEWLTGMDRRHVGKVEYPESAVERMKAIYEKKGYPREWIDKRTYGIATPKEITDEWLSRCQSEIQVF